MLSQKPLPINWKQDHLLLLQWYQQNARALPWRQNKDPYRIWLSEVMLQQTTVAAVIPYYEKFLLQFPTLQALADAELPQVLTAWAGLGYYSRARNLHQAAQILNKNGFPQTAKELLALPGFGPYTSRAVASIAFLDPVGVLDGNVIRVLSRRFGFTEAWWKTSAKNQLQFWSDTLAQQGHPDLVNQALMELGATVCTPQKPTCLLCPWQKQCLALAEQKISQCPQPKPRKSNEVWVWQPSLVRKNKKIQLIVNDYAPFLKSQWIFPGTIQKQKQKPSRFLVRHSITHHQIFVTAPAVQKKSNKKLLKSSNNANFIWILPEEIKKYNPSSLLSKTWQALEGSLP